MMTEVMFSLATVSLAVRHLHLALRRPKAHSTKLRGWARHGIEVLLLCVDPPTKCPHQPLLQWVGSVPGNERREPSAEVP